MPVLKRLEPDSERKNFDCGDSDLNDFFLNDSKNYSKELLAVTYALENGNETIAYFSVLNDSIREEDTTRSRLKKILKLIPFQKRHKSHPAVKVGRFAISNNYQKRGIGTELMDYIKVFFVDKNKTGCRFIIVDAYKEAIGFYQRNGFDFLTSKDENEPTRLMYFDLITFVRDTAQE